MDQISGQSLMLRISPQSVHFGTTIQTDTVETAYFIGRTAFTVLDANRLFQVTLYHSVPMAYTGDLVPTLSYHVAPNCFIEDSKMAAE